MKIIFLLSFDSILLSRDLLSDTLILVDNLSLLPGYFYAILFVLGILQFEYDSQCAVCLALILLDIPLASWICRFVSNINLGEIFIIYSNIASVSFFFIFLIFPLGVCYTFYSCYTVLGHSVLVCLFWSFFFFSLIFSFGSFY